MRGKTTSVQTPGKLDSRIRPGVTPRTSSPGLAFPTQPLIKCAGMDSSAEQPVHTPISTAPISTVHDGTSDGAYGEECGRAPTLAYRDERLVLRAIREKWPIPEDKRPWCVEVLLRVAETADNPRDRVAAIRALVSMEGQNMEARGEKSAPSTVNVTIAEQVVQIGRKLAGELPGPE